MGINPTSFANDIILNAAPKNGALKKSKVPTPVAQCNNFAGELINGGSLRGADAKKAGKLCSQIGQDLDGKVLTYDDAIQQIATFSSDRIKKDKELAKDPAFSACVADAKKDGYSTDNAKNTCELAKEISTPWQDLKNWITRAKK